MTSKAILESEYMDALIGAKWSSDHLMIYSYESYGSDDKLGQIILLSHNQAVELANAILAESKPEQTHDIDQSGPKNGGI